MHGARAGEIQRIVKKYQPRDDDTDEIPSYEHVDVSLSEQKHWEEHKATEEAAVRIQSHWRGYSARKVLSAFSSAKDVGVLMDAPQNPFKAQQEGTQDQWTEEERQGMVLKWTAASMLLVLSVACSCDYHSGEGTRLSGAQEGTAAFLGVLRSRWLRRRGCAPATPALCR